MANPVYVLQYKGDHFHERNKQEKKNNKENKFPNKKLQKTRPVEQVTGQKTRKWPKRENVHKTEKFAVCATTVANSV